ncbi:penicillin-binding transpeptidase domain-containing protein [Chitinilyticum aquatile]|uniref:penicillin-binding transpeptidase domain-containing protein n=1 Tax=Chitinilyticum aquatile TaxID=362520 RepID=UPI0004199C8F|nr:penicillin-binding transpeptidase domain-containing protein [Chitinilyticum aquatile]
MPLPNQHRFANLNLLVWCVVLGLGGMAAWKIYQRTLDGIALETPDQGLSYLQPWMPGEQLVVPDKEGIWLLQQNTARVLVNLADKDGKTEQIKLCDQKDAGARDPAQLVPIRIGDDFASLQAAPQAKPAKIRHPVVLTTEASRGMPVLKIEGRVSDDFRTGLQLHAEGAAGDWQMLGDGGARAQGVILNQAAWLVWNPPGATHPSGSYTHAIRLIRRQSTPYETGRDDQPCREGVLELALFEARPRDPIKRMAPLIIFPQQGGAYPARMRPGTYNIPALPVSAMEDQALFESLQTQGLLRLDSNNLIEVAPVDLPAAQDAGVKPENWRNTRLDKAARQLLDRLYSKQDGAYVLSQIRHYNQERMWSAIRISQSLQQTQGADWLDLVSAEVDGIAVSVNNTMPDVSARLFDHLPQGWSPWIRVQNWPQTASANSTIQLRLLVTAGTEFDVLSLGEVKHVEGATILERVADCRGSGCPASDMLNRLRLLAQAAEVRMTLRPETRFNTLNSATADNRNIRLHQGKLIWVPNEAAQGKAPTPAAVSIQARDGTPLYENGKSTQAAIGMGLTSLTGLSERHNNAVAGILSRLGEHGAGQAQAKLTIDPQWQKWSQQILACVGDQGHQWLADKQQCSNELLNPKTAKQVGRRTGLVLMDADSGAILALAGSPILPDGVNPDDLTAFDRYNPGSSPLRIQPLQHDSRSDQTVGSTFKLVDALALEELATTSKTLNAQLDGASAGQMAAIAQRGGYAFDAKAPCYPLGCGAKSIRNDKDHLPISYMQDGKFGLRQALSASINTWFAWQVEQSDKALGNRATGGYENIRSLGQTALQQERPVIGMAHRLGFESALQLDGGLLPADFSWQGYDVLQAMPSTFDPIDERYHLQRLATGARMQVTPLQMAMVAASIASGKVTRPYLLAELNGKAAQVSRGVPLTMPLHRIRAGMNDVVTQGTAQGAFNTPLLQPLRAGLFAKTGTPAPQGLRDDKSSFNNAWFVGYINPDTLPGEHRRLAFAIFITRTHAGGGTHAAPVLASLLETRLQHAATQH